MSGYRRFIPPDCPTCGRVAGQRCVNTRTLAEIYQPHPGRQAALTSALYREVEYLHALIDGAP